MALPTDQGAPSCHWPSGLARGLAPSNLLSTATPARRKSPAAALKAAVNLEHRDLAEGPLSGRRLAYSITLSALAYSFMADATDALYQERRRHPRLTSSVRAAWVRSDAA